MIDLDECEIPAYAPFLYSNEVVRAAIHRFKFDSHPELARRMAPLMLSALPHDLLPNLWVPVPLSRDELPKRGYNQSALLASELAKTTLSVCAPRLIRRKTGMSHQRKLARSARLANPVDAFTLAQARLVSSPARTPSGIPTVTPSGIPTMPCAQSTSVVLVDDVLTTGATARACCRVLNAAGLRPIAILTFAQVPPPEGKGVRISLSAAGG